MPVVVVSGASRGIGLEFVRQYAAEGWTVHAAARRLGDARDLRAVAGDVRLHELDVEDTAAVAAFGRVVTGAVDVVVANAGVGARDVGSLGALDYGAFARVLAVNLLGAVALCEAFLPQVKAAKGRMAGISSQMGSIADSGGGYLAYRSSKAALNMAMTVIAAELAPHGAAAAPFHPGWVQTDMGGAGAPTPVAESVSGLRARIAEMRPDPKPPFRDFAGRALPW